MATKQEYRLGDIIEPLGGRLIHGNPETTFTSFCIDSRYVDSNTLFVPLMGQSRDGHQFVLDAIGKGAPAVIVRSGHHQIHEIIEWLRERASRAGFREYNDVCVIEVRHTLVALQKLAEWFRLQFPAKVIGVTGSVGKTGTKEMLIQILSSRYSTVGTEKNFNNEIGVPLALSKLDPNVKMAVIEMAMRARGEISLLSRIAHPDVAMITNTTGAHVGRLGSFEEIYKAKCEILDGLKPGGTLILNRGDENVGRILEEIHSKRFHKEEPELKYFDASAVYANSGIPPFLPPGQELSGPLMDVKADVWLEDVKVRGLQGAQFYLCSADERVPCELNLLGRGAVANLAAAAIGAHVCGMSLAEIAEAVPALLPAPQRLNLFQLRDNLYLIDDCYNSSPASARDSLELLLNINSGYRKIAVIGDMLELGKYETLLHRQVALTTLNLPLDTVYAVGPRMNAVNEVDARDDIELYYIEGHSDYESRDAQNRPTARFGEVLNDARPQRGSEEMTILDDNASAKLSAMLLSKINQNKRPTVVLVKGSRALHLERVVNDLLSGTYEQ